MKTVLRILVISSLVSLAACNRQTGPYAGMKGSKRGNDNPQYTVEPKLNQPTK